MAEWTKEIFAKNLRFYLSNSGKTQKELAQIIGVSAPTMHEWCAGKKTPRMDKVEKLASYFNILKSDLLEDKQELNKGLTQEEQGQPIDNELSNKKKEFIQRVSQMSDAQLDLLEQILAIVENTEI